MPLWLVLVTSLGPGQHKNANVIAVAATLIAATEGAVVMSRAERSMEPFDLVADNLAAQILAFEHSGN